MCTSSIFDHQVISNIHLYTVYRCYYFAKLHIHLVKEAHRVEPCETERAHTHTAEWHARACMQNKSDIAKDNKEQS